ncbi:DedA family protein [Paenibacillus sp. GCM10023248]|uniref:DedA family protein n=1 Tax=Bacillales TaxID=1385 RepID=UPI0023799E78|nr:MULTISPECIES: DedA family protein [Bacillales]MDD9268579.1 DedA family protein [Paenibacillus sp. MAHUQ-63]MDR6879477.1 membrane protein DedA with SNARE-associated domain [Bacillus sp. 3255]
MEWISNLFVQYGYFVLILGLFAESLALPFPGELAMAISGHMSTLGSLNISIIIFCSYFGAIAGTTVTYYLGYKLGTPFFEKYGRFFFLNQERIITITKWFNKYGNKLILVSYFIPGLRHFTGYVSGILRVRLGTFLIYNFTGGLVWVFAYVMIGKIFGIKIEQMLHIISQYSIAAIIVLVVGVVIGFHIKRNKQAIIDWLRTLNWLK